MPLSNPTSRIEARPEDILRWTDGAALVATGSPFLPVRLGEQVYSIAQCNNSYIFPGIGLGVLSAHAKKVTQAMLMAASDALADASPMLKDKDRGLLPDINDIEHVSRLIAFRVGKAAQSSGVAVKMSENDLWDSIDRNYWYPEYRTYSLRKSR
jgi:malate dehydrogenase (oxaloacetate-decarboxylating)